MDSDLNKGRAMQNTSSSMPNVLLREARNKRGWSQEELADLLGVGKTTVRSWEAGRRFPSPRQQIRLCLIFALLPEQLGLPPVLAVPLNASVVLPMPDESAVGAVVGHDLAAPQKAPLILKAEEKRRRILRRVQNIWIEGVLQRSLYQATLMTLDLVDLPSALANPWRLSVQETNGSAQTLPPGTSILQMYDASSGELLILGEPGAGKTTLLLELARTLLARAEKNQDYPIPVIFNLSTWMVRQTSLVEWLVEELHSKYQVPVKVAQEWVEQDQLLVLLDGLDEVSEDARPGCVKEIDRYHQAHELVPIVVCCRREEYFAQTTRVALQKAVLIQPLTREQIDGYLSYAGTQLEAVSKGLQADADLEEMIHNPLMLSIVVLTYRGGKVPLVLTGSPEERRQQILDQYIKRMLERRGLSVYQEQQTIKWLSWLARQMKNHSQTTFYLERMQPDWLPDSHSYRQYRLAVIRVIFAVVCIVSAGSFACFRGDSFPTEPGLFFWLGGGKGSTILEWMAPGLGGGLRGAASFGIILVTVTVLAMVLGRRGGIPAITRKAVQHGVLTGLRHGLLIGSIVGIFSGLVFLHFEGWASGLLFGGGISLFGGLIIGLMSGLIALLQYEPVSLEKTQPHQNNTQPWRIGDRIVNALLFSVCASVSFAAVYAWQSGGMNQFVIIYGLIVGFFFGIVYGGNGTDLIRGLGISITPAEIVAWSWQAVQENLAANLRKGGLLGFAILGSVAFVVACISSVFHGIGYGLRYGLVYGIIVGLIAGIVGVLTGVLTSGWSSNLIEDEHHFARPNEGIHRSMRNAVFAACLFGPLGGIASGIGCSLAFGVVGGLTTWWILGAGVAIILTITFALQFLILYGGSAFLEHAILRWYLWRKGLIPWKYIAFLDYAGEHILLQKMAGGYMFIHRLLLEHFAYLEDHQAIEEKNHV